MGQGIRVSSKIMNPEVEKVEVEAEPAEELVELDNASGVEEAGDQIEEVEPVIIAEIATEQETLTKLQLKPTLRLLWLKRLIQKLKNSPSQTI